MATSRLANKVRSKIKQNKAKEAKEVVEAAAASLAASQDDLVIRQQPEIVVQSAEEGSVEQYTSIQSNASSDSGQQM